MLIMFFGTVSFSQNSRSTRSPRSSERGQVSLLRRSPPPTTSAVRILKSDGTIVFDTKANNYSNNVIALMTNCECLSW